MLNYGNGKLFVLAFGFSVVAIVSRIVLAVIAIVPVVPIVAVTLGTGIPLLAAARRLLRLVRLVVPWSLARLPYTRWLRAGYRQFA